MKKLKNLFDTGLPQTVLIALALYGPLAYMATTHPVLGLFK